MPVAAATMSGADRTARPTNTFMPQNLKSDIHEFAVKADNMAKEIISANTSDRYDGPVVIRHYHHYNDPFWVMPYYSPWYSYSRPSVIILDGDGSNRNRRRGNRDDSGDAILGILSVAVAIAAMYFIGKTVNKLSDANELLDETKAFKYQLERYQPLATDLKDIQRIYQADKAVELKDRIATRLKNSAAADLALRISFAVGAGALGVGFFTSTAMMLSPLVPVGATLAAVALAAMLFKAGMDSSDTKNYRDAQSLHVSAQQLLAK